MSQQRAQGSYGTYELIEYFLNPSTQKSVGNLREKEAAALKICFGAYFRSPSLGLRHVDKGTVCSIICCYKHKLCKFYLCRPLNLIGL